MEKDLFIANRQEWDNILGQLMGINPYPDANVNDLPEFYEEMNDATYYGDNFNG